MTTRAVPGNPTFPYRATKRPSPIPLTLPLPILTRPWVRLLSHDPLVLEIFDLKDIANWIAARDDADAIDQGNVIGGRTRGAKPSGGYREPSDEEGLPGPEDGTSSTR